MDSLEKQIIAALPQAAEEINRMQFGSIELIVQGGKFIRFEIHKKQNVIKEA